MKRYILSLSIVIVSTIACAADQPPTLSQLRQELRTIRRNGHPENNIDQLRNLETQARAAMEQLPAIDARRVPLMDFIDRDLRNYIATLEAANRAGETLRTRVVNEAQMLRVNGPTHYPHYFGPSNRPRRERLMNYDRAGGYGVGPSVPEASVPGLSLSEPLPETFTLREYVARRASLGE